MFLTLSSIMVVYPKYELSVHFSRTTHLRFPRFTSTWTLLAIWNLVPPQLYYWFNRYLNFPLSYWSLHGALDTGLLVLFVFQAHHNQGRQYMLAKGFKWTPWPSIFFLYKFFYKNCFNSPKINIWTPWP